MLDIKFIRENPEKVKDGIAKKGARPDLVDAVLELDKKRRGYLQKVEELKARQNKLGKDHVEEAKEIKNQIKELAPELESIEKELHETILRLPNLPFEDVPVGDESKSVVLREAGEKPNFDFQSKDYMELGESLDLIDVKRAGKVAGSRFGYLKREAALIEFALMKLAFDALTKEGFIPVVPPVMLKSQMARGMGYLEQTDKEEAYYLPQDDLYLAGTAEQPLGTLHADEIFDEQELPRRYAGFSTCFRREAGSYGKDTKGIFRVHQFDKIEMFSYAKPEDSKKEHEFLLGLQEKFMKQLELPYHVVLIASGDLGNPAAKKYDIETWLPSEGRYRETHSTSNCTDYQARRLNIRYRKKDGGIEFVHTLNGTVFAIGRMLIMIMENCQQKDGSIAIPKVLQKYIGKKKIERPV
ncbi:MAG: serine--tRNA ligase [Candidatus Wildermuthbacteria bacterium]|nr:serine--tRNA ligase [Candidatus Wildermuthbacteria bacterium]